MLTVQELSDFSVINIELNGPIGPEVLREVTLPSINPRKGVVLSGRGPIWLYAWLIHECHPTKWVACYDPRLGAVVVSSHSPEMRVGDVIDISL